ncbi:MAG: alpha-keto acid decarboxylase family protein [Candidatus Scalindua sp. AMX11]|nr:MAG: alpha-keto acid decarboxylase family protein [Candidatus Scalindua sp.]NOG82719.1 alpha-keto acid decarboxylase family protein [Planctomycetota bacterium]RZV95289.1 MAG: alpha-keto acid decarboxylase family protein [Candidatus Scalindua sp. SCAELEC01]TDE66231.1 MAG: alpha-keto acid decarboxylase family protein [Candidatus Scalindua sp. AMX11]GJQ57851.1 MAG: preprotein translocase subunit Tim44 [Candidatus Scalindua sp.]
MNNCSTISGYLIQQLSTHGVRHVFGVPGDYVLGFFHELQCSKLRVINTCDEQGAGYAADAYARIAGLGAVCVTYCVGGLKLANTTAQAFAEKSPVIVMSGAPGTNERSRSPLLHHKVRDFNTQLKVFEQLTVASTVLDNPHTACREIHRVFNAALRYKRPVYIEIPRDMVSVPVSLDNIPDEKLELSDMNTLNEALREAGHMINTSKRPVIIAGIELHRFGLQKELLEFVENTRIPVVSTLLSKSVMSEHHPLYLGVYGGAMGREEVIRYVESSDCLILLGTFMTDINLGIFTAHLDQGCSLSVTSEKISIRYHSYEDIRMEDFIRGMLKINICRRKERGRVHPPLAPPDFIPGRKITIRHLYQRLNSFLEKEMVVIADTGDAMFAAMDMTIHEETEFLSAAYYASLGFAVPASLGVQMAKPELRPLVLVGDGAFQMTGMELSTIARYHLNPIVVILNNRGYGTERYMRDGPFNDLTTWEYSRIPEIIKSGKGFDIKTEDQLEDALCAVRDYTEDFCILDVHIDQEDCSIALQRMTKALKKRT